jgi:hypothetical protein
MVSSLPVCLIAGNTAIRVAPLLAIYQIAKRNQGIIGCLIAGNAAIWIASNMIKTHALCSTHAGGVGLTVGTPFVPTLSGRHGAQGGSKAPRSSRGGTGRFFRRPTGEKIPEPPFDATEHRGSSAGIGL